MDQENYEKLLAENPEYAKREKRIRKLKSVRFPALTGYFKRKLKRNQTVHYRPLCPVCGMHHVRYYKVLRIGPKTYMHDVFYCRGCGKKFEFKDLYLAVKKKEEEKANV